MEKFMFLFRGGDTHIHTAKDTEEVKAYIESWNTWMGGLAQQGILEGGEALQTTGKLVTGKDKVVTDGSFVDAQDMVGGNLIVKAKDIHEAVEISKGCPIFKENGKVEVRQIQKRGN